MIGIVDTYGLGKIQDLLTLDRELAQAGYAMGDLEAFVEAKRKALRKKERIRAVPVKACICGSGMILLPVNTRPSDQTGDNSKHVWFCNACLEQEFTNQTYNQIIAEAERLRGG